MFKDIKIVAFDFDGVFTDNHVFIDELGTETVKCFRGDGYGLARLRQAGVETFVISSEVNPVVESRCRKLGVDCVSGCEDKLSEVKRRLQSRGFGFADLCYVGNDINDLECLKAAAVGVAVADAVDEVKPYADHITAKKGGFGAVREICDLIYRSAKTEVEPR